LGVQRFDAAIGCFGFRRFAGSFALMERILGSLPFTGNRQFKRDPRMVVAAEVRRRGIEEEEELWNLD